MGNKWQILKDSKPKDMQRVLVAYMETNEIEIAQYMTEQRYRACFLADDGNYHQLEEIYAWQSLPRKPYRSIEK